MKIKKINYIIIISLILLSLITLQLLFQYTSSNFSVFGIKESKFASYNSENNLIEYLFIGDSRAANGINTDTINNSFNYAIPGESYVENYYKLKYILKKNISVENIVLEVDSSMNEDYERFERYIYFSKNFISIRDLLGYSLHPKVYINYFFGFLGRGSYFGLLFFEPQEITKTGFVVNNGEYKPTLNVSANVSSINIESVDLAYLEKIINISKRNNVSIIAMKYPLPKESLNRKNQFKINYYERLSTILNSNKIQLLDYETLFAHNSSLFADGSHLNYNGASRLANIVDEDLNSIKEGNFMYCPID